MLVEKVFDTFSFLPIDAFMVFTVGKKSVNYEIRKASVFLVSQLLKELFKLWVYFAINSYLSHGLLYTVQLSL